MVMTTKMRIPVEKFLNTRLDFMTVIPLSSNIETTNP
jgi:hypothetical protein